jgi:hypothetical protein
MNNVSASAKVLGRLGGHARALRLSPAERRRIAALGGAARKRSLEIARRIAENFAYVQAMDALGEPQPKPTRASTCEGPLPGIFPDQGGYHGH